MEERSDHEFIDFIEDNINLSQCKKNIQWRCIMNHFTKPIFLFGHVYVMWVNKQLFSHRLWGVHFFCYLKLSNETRAFQEISSKLAHYGIFIKISTIHFFSNTSNCGEFYLNKLWWRHFFINNSHLLHIHNILDYVIYVNINLSNTSYEAGSLRQWVSI